MAQTDLTRSVLGAQWRDIALALLAAFVFFTVWESLEIALGTSIGPTVEALQLLVAGTAFGIISFSLLRSDFELGYVLTALTGLYGILALVLVRTGTVGGIKPGTPSFGPVVFLLVAALLVVSTYLAWRDRS